MSSEILSILEYMEKEKGIDRADMISTISSALVTAAQKSVNAGQELRIEIDPKTGIVSAWILLEVVDSLSDPKTQIHIEKATEFLENPQKIRPIRRLFYGRLQPTGLIQNSVATCVLSIA